MSEWNYEILKSNINELIKNKQVTQNQLAEAIDMTQSNLSKCLNKSNEQRFNVEQLFKIAEFFNVSVDSLLGRKVKSDIYSSTKNICEFLAAALKENCKAKIYPIKIEEECAVGYDEHGLRTFKNKTNDYKAIYFPSFFDLATEEKYCIDENERYALNDEYCQCGNELIFNQKINSFIEKIAPIIELYKKHELTDEVYNVVLNNFLNDIDTRK